MDLRPSTLKALFLEGMRQANGEDDPPDEPEVPPPPPPDKPPTVHLPPAAPGRAENPGYTEWRNGRPWHIIPPPPPPPEPKKTGAKPCDHPNPHAVHVRPTGRLVAYWCEDCETQLPVPEDYDELDDGEDGEGGVPAKIRRQWGVRGSGKKVYSRPAYRTAKSEKKSLIDAWHGMRPVTRHGLYNGVALGIGFWVGVPQFFTAEVAHLVATYHSWTALYVWFWYFVAASIWALDYKARDWLPPLAFLARVPLVSMIIGALLYGGPAAV